jgi:hypothetical protein
LEGVGGVAVVFGHEVRDAGAAVAELGAGAAGLDDGDADPEWFDFGGDGFAEAFDAPFGGVVERVAREGDLTAVRGDLDDPAAALPAEVRQSGADER